MSQPGHPPRDYQIAELTRGAEFPLPALKSRPLKVIAEFLVRAWEGLLETHAARNAHEGRTGNQYFDGISTAQLA